MRPVWSRSVVASASVMCACLLLGCSEDDARLGQARVPVSADEGVTEMLSTDADDAFRALLAQRGLTVERLDAERATAAMSDFYALYRAIDVDGGEQGDMLLFQWGTYDWGRGPAFEYDITRQFIVEGYEEPDAAIWQLSLTVRYEPDHRSAALEHGNRWCEHPAKLDAFSRFIENSDATNYARSEAPESVELRFEQAG